MTSLFIFVTHILAKFSCVILLKFLPKSLLKKTEILTTINVKSPRFKMPLVKLKDNRLEVEETVPM